MSIHIPIAAIGTMMKFDLEQPPDCFRQDVQWTFASCYKLLTFSTLDLDHVHDLAHCVLQDKDTNRLPERN